VRRCSAAFEASFFKPKIVVFAPSSDHSHATPEPATHWPHAPSIDFRKAAPILLQQALISSSPFSHTAASRRFAARSSHRRARLLLELEAWAVFSNLTTLLLIPERFERRQQLSQMLGVLHTRTAGWINRLDKTPGRKVWHNFWIRGLPIRDRISRG